jgi:hypothetical protein
MRAHEVAIGTLTAPEQRALVVSMSTPCPGIQEQPVPAVGSARCRRGALVAARPPMLGSSTRLARRRCACPMRLVVPRWVIGLGAGVRR